MKGQKTRICNINDDFEISLRSPDISDLLTDRHFVPDEADLKGLLCGSSVLVTGGGGSIGSELCRQIAKFSPKKIVMLDNYENNVFELANELKSVYPDVLIETVIASIRDKERLISIFSKHRPKFVFHTAAHKHVTLMEENPSEAVKNNIFGTLNLCDCADKYKTEKFIFISTDKAVKPQSIMGASKAVCEMLLNVYGKKSRTVFSTVRFGNVLGSSGSVIPIFKRQIERGGPVTVTDKNATRYFMSISEAVSLVLQAAIFSLGNEVFVLDMGEQYKIYDIALMLIRLCGKAPFKDVEIVEIGLRDGEKLTEELLSDHEELLPTKNSKIYVTKPSSVNEKKLKKYLMKLKKAAKKDDGKVIGEVLYALLDGCK